MTTLDHEVREETEDELDRFLQDALGLPRIRNEAGQPARVFRPLDTIRQRRTPSRTREPGTPNTVGACAGSEHS